MSSKIMKGSREEVSVLENLIARGQEDRDRQLALLHEPTSCGRSTAEVLAVLGEIEDSLAGLRSRRAYLRTLPGAP